MPSYTTPDFLRSALITIDTQRDTLDGRPLEIPGTSTALPRIASLVQHYRARALPVVHVVRIYQRNGSNVDACRRALVEQGAELLLEGSAGCELAEGLLNTSGPRLDSEVLLAGRLQQVGPAEWIMYKPRWGAFYDTPLDSHLEGLGVNTLVFAGCNFPNCPRTSIYQASERDYRVALVSDAVSGLYPRGVAELENIGVVVMETSGVLSEIVPGTVPDSAR